MSSNPAYFSTTAGFIIAIIDGTLIQVGNHLKLDAPGGRAQAAAWEQFTSSDFVVTQKNVVGDAIIIRIASNY